MTRTLRITLAGVAAGVEWLHAIDVAEGSTVADAIAASRSVMPAHLALAPLQFAIYGQRAGPDTPLANGDRIELTGPLLVDPKFARLARARAKPLPKSHTLRTNAKAKSSIS